MSSRNGPAIAATLPFPPVRNVLCSVHPLSLVSFSHLHVHLLKAAGCSCVTPSTPPPSPPPPGQIVAMGLQAATQSGRMEGFLPQRRGTGNAAQSSGAPPLMGLGPAPQPGMPPQQNGSMPPRPATPQRHTASPRPQQGELAAEIKRSSPDRHGQPAPRAGGPPVRPLGRPAASPAGPMSPPINRQNGAQAQSRLPTPKAIPKVWCCDSYVFACK